jgi:hypothetical protein
MGESVLKYDKYCRGTKDYLSLAREIMMLDRPASEQYVPKEQKSVQKRVEKVLLEEVAVEQASTTAYEPTQRMQELVAKESSEFLGLASFSLNAPSAQSVFVTGSFNDWSLDEKCRMSHANGIWNLNVSLKPGVYKYQFIVDGKWQEDPENKNIERNSFGDINSLIEVKA